MMMMMMMVMVMVMVMVMMKHREKQVLSDENLWFPIQYKGGKQCAVLFIWHIGEDGKIADDILVGSPKTIGCREIRF